YTDRLLVGNHRSVVDAEASFTFEKQAGAAADAPFALGGEGLLLAAAEAPPTAAVLSAASPNPTASRARLTLTLPAAEAVRAEAFDARGRRVAVLHDGPLGAGAHALVLDGQGLPGGVYVVRVTGTTFAASRRVTLLR